MLASRVPVFRKLLGFGTGGVSIPFRGIEVRFVVAKRNHRQIKLCVFADVLSLHKTCTKWNICTDEVRVVTTTHLSIDTRARCLPVSGSVAQVEE